MCDKAFTYFSDLKVHNQVHSGDKPYHCTIYDKSFSHSSSLNPHQMTHFEEKLFPCTFCDKSFSKLSHLQSHLIIHTGKTPFLCSKCAKSFSHSKHLRKHMIIHTGEQPNSCPGKFVPSPPYHQRMIPYGKRQSQTFIPKPCAFCRREFRDKITVVQHTVRRHLAVLY